MSCFMCNDGPLEPPSFRCPVCRAKQSLQDQCRRCHADLSLLVKVKRRVAYLVASRQAAKQAGDLAAAEHLHRELQRLAADS